MNYYDVLAPVSNDRFYEEYSFPMTCCAAAEINLDYAMSDKGTPEKAVEAAILESMEQENNRTQLFWFVAHHLKSNRDCLPIVAGLPATKFVDEYINSRTGHKITVFVTNLREEW